MRKRIIQGAIFIAVLLMVVGGMAWWKLRPSADLPAPANERAVEIYERRTLPRIPPDTVFGKGPPVGWSHILQFVTGRIDAGDVDEVTSLMQKGAEEFNLVLLANVTKGKSGQPVLDKVGVGYSTPQDGKNVIVSEAGDQKSKVKLSLTSASLLDIHEGSLDEFIQLARNDNGCLFESGIMMLRDGQHKKMVERYFVSASPDDGTLQTTVWLTTRSEADGKIRYALAEPKLLRLPENLRENRSMHIDGKKVFLGIPKPDALAVVKLPPGKEYPVTESFEKLATLETYDANTFEQLREEIRNITK